MTDETQTQGTEEKQGPSVKVSIAGDYYSASITVDPGDKPDLVTHDFIFDNLKKRKM